MDMRMWPCISDCYQARCSRPCPPVHTASQQWLHLAPCTCSMGEHSASSPDRLIATSQQQEKGMNMRTWPCIGDAIRQGAPYLSLPLRGCCSATGCTCTCSIDDRSASLPDRLVASSQQQEKGMNMRTWPCIGDCYQARCSRLLSPAAHCMPAVAVPCTCSMDKRSASLPDRLIATSQQQKKGTNMRMWPCIAMLSGKVLPAFPSPLRGCCSATGCTLHMQHARAQCILARLAISSISATVEPPSCCTQHASSGCCCPAITERVAWLLPSETAEPAATTVGLAI